MRSEGRRVVLHVGPHKTGTTAIQDALHRNRETLARAGWHYPEIGFTQQGHHRLAQALLRHGQPEAEQMLAELAALDGDIVLSSENFSRLPLQPLKRLAEGLRPRQVTVVCYQRNFLDLAYSWWQERVKHGDRADLMSFLFEIAASPRKPHLFAPRMLLGRLAEAFGRESVSVFLYDPIRAGKGIVAHFMEEVLGVDRSAWPEPGGQPNRSLRPAMAEVLRMLNRTAGRDPARQLLSDPRMRSLRDLMATQEHRYLRIVALSYRMAAFRQMEQELLAGWRDRIATPLPAEGQVFADREREIAFLDPAIWLFEPQLAEALRAFASQRAA